MGGKETHPVESSHGLISTADLDLEEGGLAAVAGTRGALDPGLLGIVPGLRPAEYVFPLLAGEILAREDGLGDGVLVGTCSALEPVVSCVHPGEDQEVGAIWADCFFPSFLSVTSVGFGIFNLDLLEGRMTDIG